MKKFSILFIAVLINGLSLLRAESIQLSTSTKQSVVELHIVQKPMGLTADTKKRTKELLGHSVCSGAFITPMGDIITAGHCAQNAISIEVTTYDNQSYTAVVIATSSVHDLALIHIDKRNTAYFRPADKAERGENIFILGSPLGITDSLSTGIISKLSGDQTLVDCGALPGNSGSAVFDTDGNLVGVLTAGYIVGFGVTHLNVAQSIDAVWFFVSKALSEAH